MKSFTDVLEDAANAAKENNENSNADNDSE